MNRSNMRWGKIAAGVVAGVAIVAVAAGAGYVLLTGNAAQQGGVVSPQENIDIFDTPAQDKPEEFNKALPFRIAGADDGGAVYEISDIVTGEAPTAAWQFGGDFSQIGAFPLSGSTVFGSASNTPNDLQSYAPAFISKDGAEYLAEVDTDPYYEPRTGSEGPDGVVWYAATLSSQYQVSVNNWKLMYRDASSGEVRELGTAQKLNGTEETPAAPGDFAPTANGTHAYYASMMPAGEDSWRSNVLQFALDGASDPVVVAPGAYPCATADGVLYASDLVSEEGVDQGYASVVERLGNDDTAVLTVDTAASGWCVSGVWSAGDARVVAISKSTGDAGTYLGIWKGGFAHCEAWIHVNSPAVAGSIAEGGFAWGSGSQYENPEMYLVRFDALDSAQLLGSAEGYARPALSRDASAVLVPVYNGMDAVKFDVVELG